MNQLEYTYAIGDAGDRYLASVAFEGKYRLPAQFRWAELWEQMVLACLSKQMPIAWEYEAKDGSRYLAYLPPIPMDHEDYTITPLIAVPGAPKHDVLKEKNDRIAALEQMLREAKNNHALMLTSNPPQCAWTYHQMDRRIDELLGSK